MFNQDGSLRCCNPKFNNCPTVTIRTDGVAGVVVEGDDGQMVEFDAEQFAVLLRDGPILMAKLTP